MTDEQKATQEELRTPFEGMPFAAMMQKMMGRQGTGCTCVEMMSQMMTPCGQAQTEEKKPPPKQPGKHKGKQNVN